MIATSSTPVGFFRPPPIRPIARAGNPRNVDNRSTHCSCNCRRCTRTSVLTPRSAISHAAMTVFPKAVVADEHAGVVGKHGSGGQLLLRAQVDPETYQR